MDLGLYGGGRRRWWRVESVDLSVAHCGGLGGRWREVEAGRQGGLERQLWSLWSRWSRRGHYRHHCASNLSSKLCLWGWFSMSGWEGSCIAVSALTTWARFLRAHGQD